MKLKSAQFAIRIIHSLTDRQTDRCSARGIRAMGARSLEPQPLLGARKISERELVSRIRRDLDQSNRLVEAVTLNLSVRTECIG